MDEKLIPRSPSLITLPISGFIFIGLETLFGIQYWMVVLNLHK